MKMLNAPHNLRRLMFFGLLFALMLVLLSLGSCTTYEKCVSRFGVQQDTITVPVRVEVPVEVPLPPDTLRVEVPVLKRDTVIKKQTRYITQRIEIKDGQLTSEAALRDTSLRDTVVHTDTVRIQPPPAICPDCDPTTMQTIYMSIGRFTFWLIVLVFAAILGAVLLQVFSPIKPLNLLKR